MTSEWTRRDTTNVLRLLKKYNRLNGPDKEISAAIEHIDRWVNDPLTLYDAKLDTDILMHLDWWCGIVEARYGIKRHTAIKWLVKQYHGKLSTKSFCAEFGNATVDSIARRLGQKAKQQKDFLSVYRRENFEPIFKEHPNADIYQITFKLLKLWREPRVETGTQMSTSASKVST